MARTPLFAALQAAFAAAAPPALPRRALLGGLAAAPLAARAQPRGAPRDARIAILGGGLAGLVALHRLVEAGATRVTLHEGNTRLGGRVFSGRDLLGPGTVCELGGSFINTEHEDMLALAREFALALEDGAAGEEAALRARYWVGGAPRSLEEIAAAAAPMLPRLAAMREAPEPEQRALDREPAAALLDRLGASGWLRALLDIGLTQEMGLEPGRMSGMYLVEAFAPDPRQPRRGLFSSDQRFQLAGGNDTLPAALARRHAARIETGQRVAAVRRRGSGYAIAFAGGREALADVVVCALPVPVLRQVVLDIGAPPLTRRAIRELAFGTNAKLFAGLAARPWRAQGLSGELLHDLGSQTAWEDHGGAGTGPGGVTIFAGGPTGAGFAQGPHGERAAAALRALEPALPGAAAAFNGRTSRMAWPQNPFAGGSYSCFGPGQWFGLAGAFAPVGRFVFAGEHTSEAHSGYMNGAAESGRLAAEAVVAMRG
jgi:monoamine oxidase